MNSLEDLVRETLRARADEITPDSIPPLRLAAPARGGPACRRSRTSSFWLDGGRAGRAGPGRGPARPAGPPALRPAGPPALRPADPPARRPADPPAGGPRSWIRLTIPAVAAVSVISVFMVVSALSGGHLVPVAGNKAAGSGAAGPAGPTIGRAAPAAVAAAIPAYYIALTGTRKPFPSPDVAGVYSSRTGARLATVVPPRPDRTFIAVSAAADDRTFAVAAQASDGQETSRAVTFYRVRFSPADGTHLTALTAITVPAGATFDGFALSPDGKRLAVASEPNRTALGINGEIQVATLASGRVSTWSSADGAVGGDTAGPWTLSWTGDGRTLAFNWLGYGQYASRITARMAAATGLRLLPAGAPPGDLVKQSRLALHWRDDGSRALASGGAVSDVAMITPDGRRIVAALVGAPADRAPARAGPLAGFAAFSAATGAREYLRGWRRTQPDRSGGPTDILWTSATGDVLIVYAPPGHRGRIGVLRGEQLTQLTLLPQSPAAQFPAAAW